MPGSRRCESSFLLVMLGSWRVAVKENGKGSVNTLLAARATAEAAEAAGHI